MRAIALNAPPAWGLGQNAWIFSAAGPSLLLMAAVFATALACIEFTRSAGTIAALWPSNAIVLAALLRNNRSSTSGRSLTFLGAFAGILLANLARSCSQRLWQGPISPKSELPSGS